MDNNTIRIKNIKFYVFLADKGQLFTRKELLETGLFYGDEGIENYFIFITTPDGDLYTTEKGLDYIISLG